MNVVKEMYVCEGARTSYSFLHLSIQEFIAAWHVSNHPELSTKFISDSDRLIMYPCFDPFLIWYYRAKYVYRSSIIMTTLIKLLLHCLYESQNPKFVSKFFESSQHIYSIDIDRPLDLYVFGYILVHAPIRWRATISTSSDMLVSSLKDHESSRTKILGSISELILLKELSEHSKRNNLPSCVTEHMTFFCVEAIANVFSEWIPTLSDLNDVVLI